MKKEFKSKLEQRYGHLETLPNIAANIGVNINTMNRWAERSRKNDFPEPIRVQGRYKLYDQDAVAEWVYLWQKINKNFGQASKLNKGTDNG